MHQQKNHVYIFFLLKRDKGKIKTKQIPPNFLCMGDAFWCTRAVNECEQKDLKGTDKSISPVTTGVFITVGNVNPINTNSY